jgi:CheY-like chemotaxis protein
MATLAPKETPSDSERMARHTGFILSVDDEPAILFTRAILLQRLGYGVLNASDGAEALKVFASYPIALVLLDYEMPGMDGGMIARAMKAAKPDVPVIMVSAGRVPSEALTSTDCFIDKGASVLLLEKISEFLAPAASQDSNGTNWSAEV